MADRFKVVDLDEAKKYNDPHSYVEYASEWDYNNYLVDTATDDVIWSDGMEPEDATLVRDLYFFVDLLNKVGGNEA